MRIAIALGALVVAAALVGLLVLSRDSPHSVPVPTAVGVPDATVSQDVRTAVQPPVLAQDAPPVPQELPPQDDSPQLRAVRSSGVASEPWAGDAAALAARLAPGSSTACFVAGCVVDVPPAALEAARRAFAADTTWTGGKQWLGTTLILYRPD